MPRAQTLLVATLLLIVPLAGCVQTLTQTLEPAGAREVPSFTHLQAPNATEVLDGTDGTRSFVWKGMGPGGVTVILVTPPVGPNPPDQKFQVDPAVGFVSLNLTYTGSSVLQAFLVDHNGKIQCGTGDIREKTQECTAPTTNVTALSEWAVRVRTAYGGGMPGMAYTLTATLHPASHMTWGDPMDGVDRNITFNPVDTKGGATESNIGIDSKGAIYAQFDLQTLKSTDDGATWKNVAPATQPPFTFDPMLYVDPYYDMVLVDQLYIGCSYLAWSKDGGSTWVQNPAACGLPSNDHQKIATGHHPIPGSPCPMIYYSWMSITDPTTDYSGYTAAMVARSYDCGATFIASKAADTRSDGLINNVMMAADQKGNVYVPLYMCDKGGRVVVASSNDHGATFTTKVVDDEPETCTDVDPGIAFDSENTVYVAYHRESGIKYVYSKDGGKTWSEPRLVSPAGQKSWVHVDAVAGDAGKLAIVYRATPDTAKGPDLADGWARWYLYTTFVEDATGATPKVTTALVGTPEDPVQRGPICTMGVACAGGSRNLLDFIDVAVGPDGRVYPVFADGCAPAEAGRIPCPTPADSRADIGAVGIQLTGPRLFAERAPWAKETTNRAASLLGVI